MADNKPLSRGQKEDMQVTQQIFHNLLEITELFPQYTLAQHLATIIRRKSESGPELYDWTSKELLKHVEDHKAELEDDLLLIEVDAYAD